MKQALKTMDEVKTFISKELNRTYEQMEIAIGYIEAMKDIKEDKNIIKKTYDNFHELKGKETTLETIYRKLI